MATLKLAVTPDKAAKDGTHKIRIALGHKRAQFENLGELVKMVIFAA